MDIKKEVEKSLREQSQFVSVTIAKASHRYPGRDKCKKRCTSVNLNCH